MGLIIGLILMVIIELAAAYFIGQI